MSAIFETHTAFRLPIAEGLCTPLPLLAYVDADPWHFRQLAFYTDRTEHYSVRSGLGHHSTVCRPSLCPFPSLCSALCSVGTPTNSPQGAHQLLQI